MTNIATDSRVIASVAVEGTLYSFDKLYDYIVPNDIYDRIVVGTRVTVPFGAGKSTAQRTSYSRAAFSGTGKTRTALVMKIHTVSTEELTTGELSKHRMKYVLDVIDEHPPLTDEMVSLVAAMKERCFCTYYDAVRAMLPVGINCRITYEYSLSEQGNEIIAAKENNFDNSSGKDKGTFLPDDEQRRILDVLAQRGKFIKRETLFTLLGYSRENDELIQLINEGIVVKRECVKRRVGDKTEKMIRLSDFDNELNYSDTDNASLAATHGVKLSAMQGEVYELLRAVGEATVKEVCYYTGAGISVLNALVKKGVCKYFEREVYRKPKIGDNIDFDNKPIKSVDIVLTDEQNAAYKGLLSQASTAGESGKRSKPALLYGVTGSGKTSVFLKLIEDILHGDSTQKQGGIIVMVPEIALTPQMVSLFKERFGDDVAVFHSGLSVGERYDEWKRVRRGNVRIAVGTRSAVFAPFEKISLIIMDEEQEYTYKSESTPRYHAGDVAKLRCAYHGALLVLASATPSVESFYLAQKGVYSLYMLAHRYGKANLPDVLTADMNIELSQGNRTGFSSVLLESLDENLQRGEQSILLLNRRGYHTFVTCKACRKVVTCPHCSISLTYHSANNRLMCHYCGFSMDITDKCPECSQRGLRYSGSGTQRAEQTLTEIFPNARVLRLDADTTMRRYSHEEKLSDFRAGRYDIMIGTQMVAKGLDFPKVTLVGVLSADQALYGDDFRSYERAFSLITQVVGRSGRADLHGRAIVQTYTPENPIIQLAAQQNYLEFYESEIPVREAMLYPPYCDICMLALTSEDEQQCVQGAAALSGIIKKLVEEQYANLPLRLLPPTAATVYRVSDCYRYKVIVKCRNSKDFRQMMSKVLTEFSSDKRFKDVSLAVDMNPESIW